MTEGREETRRCTATRTNGKPCRAWALRNSDPPRCPAHGAGGCGAARHVPTGGYGTGELGTREAAPVTITEIIQDLARKQGALSDYIDACIVRGEVDLGNLAHLFALHGLNASRLGRLLRDQRALSGAAADGIAGAIAQALDELSTELGADL
jgi:hypothetical protein